MTMLMQVVKNDDSNNRGWLIVGSVAIFSLQYNEPIRLNLYSDIGMFAIELAAWARFLRVNRECIDVYNWQSIYFMNSKQRFY